MDFITTIAQMYFMDDHCTSWTITEFAGQRPAFS